MIASCVRCVGRKQVFAQSRTADVLSTEAQTEPPKTHRTRPPERAGMLPLRTSVAITDARELTSFSILKLVFA